MTGKLPERLFVARVAPHKPVGASTLAHLFVDLMQSAGIDTKTFKSHKAEPSKIQVLEWYLKNFLMVFLSPIPNSTSYSHD